MKPISDLHWGVLKERVAMARASKQTSGTFNIDDMDRLLDEVADARNRAESAKKDGCTHPAPVEILATVAGELWSVVPIPACVTATEHAPAILRIQRGDWKWFGKPEDAKRVASDLHAFADLITNEAEHLIKTGLR